VGTDVRNGVKLCCRSNLSHWSDTMLPSGYWTSWQSIVSTLDPKHFLREQVRTNFEQTRQTFDLGDN
jgi:hypothetical protein